MTDNFFNDYDWDTILSSYPCKNDFDLNTYHKILCPEFPEFLYPYLQLSILRRLKGIGLLCGTDWTALYKNRFFYSRYDHSVGVALIIWNFTHNKAQTIAGLLHDVSTPVFSHVSDFRKGDALTQTATEDSNVSIIKNDSELINLLKKDNLKLEEIQDYHIYPVADNEIPRLSADRLEYMFPSGMALEGSWSLNEVKEVYNDISVLINEDGCEELGFNSVEKAEKYCKKFCMTGHVLQLNENKLTLELLGRIMNLAVEVNVLSEKDFMTLSEKIIIEKLEKLEQKLNLGKKLGSDKNTDDNSDTENHKKIHLLRLYRTFRKMNKIEHLSSFEPGTENDYFWVNLKVKQRYINPLVKINREVSADMGTKARRLSEVSPKSASLIKDFLSYQDSEWGRVKLI